MSKIINLALLGGGLWLLTHKSQEAEATTQTTTDDRVNILTILNINKDLIQKYINNQLPSDIKSLTDGLISMYKMTKQGITLAFGKEKTAEAAEILNNWYEDSRLKEPQGIIQNEITTISGDPVFAQKITSEITNLYKQRELSLIDSPLSRLLDEVKPTLTEEQKDQLKTLIRKTFPTLNRLPGLSKLTNGRVYPRCGLTGKQLRLSTIG